MREIDAVNKPPGSAGASPVARGEAQGAAEGPSEVAGARLNKAEAGAPGDHFSERGRRKGGPTARWLRDAAAALEPGPDPKRAAARRTAADELAAVKRIDALISGPLADYSLEEVRRYLEPKLPWLSPGVMKRTIEPLLGERHRVVDRLGPQPNFLVAAHLAYRLLAASPGTKEDVVFADLLAELGGQPMVELRDLRRIYPFVPTWPHGVKSSSCLGFDDAPGRWPTLDAAVWAKHLRETLSELHEIPLRSELLERVHAARDEHDMLAGCRLVEVAHGLAGKYPFLMSLVRVDGMRGADVTLLSKAYGTTERVADVFRRVFGVTLEVVDGREEVVSERAKRAIESCSAPGANGDVPPLLVHVEGVHIWDWIDEHRRRHPGLRIAGVSHTSSDARDLARRAPGLPVVMMSTSDAKETDEVERFRHDFHWLVPAIGRALDADGFYERRFLVIGYGRIMGRAAALAFSDMKYDHAVFDIDPKRREEAARAGHEVLTSLADERGREVVALVGVGQKALGPEELDGFWRGGIFISVGTGQADIDVQWLERKSREAGYPPEYRMLPGLGEQPLALYRVPGPGGLRNYYVAARGFPANLGMRNPTMTEYSATTYILVSESLRQAKWLLDHGASGCQQLDSIRIDRPAEVKARVITLFGRAPGKGRREAPPLLKPVVRLLQHTDSSWAIQTAWDEPS